MFTASKALNGAQAKHYYDSEWKRGDYYTRSDEATLIPGRWFGRAAAELGYTGDVDARAFGALLEGRGSDGEPITAAEHGTGARRAGWDFTASADKSVSIVALALGDERLIAAHTAAVERAVAELENHVQTRMRHGKNNAAREVQTTGRLAAALFQHESSRRSGVSATWACAKPCGRHPRGAPRAPSCCSTDRASWWRSRTTSNDARQ